jgi:hypothetical protein
MGVNETGRQEEEEGAHKQNILGFSYSHVDVIRFHIQ